MSYFDFKSSDFIDEVISVMKIANVEARLIVLTDKNGKVIAGFTQDDAIITADILVMVEKEVGDIRFVQLEDGSVQAAPNSKDIAFPVGTMNSTEFITKFKELQKQQEEQNKNSDVVTSDNDSALTVDPLEDIDVEDVEILEE